MTFGSGLVEEGSSELRFLLTEKINADVLVRATSANLKEGIESYMIGRSLIILLFNIFF